jgi:hypothetical protein
MEDKNCDNSPKKEHMTMNLRPKTAITSSSAVNYADEGVEDPDFTPQTDIFYTSEV